MHADDAGANTSQMGLTGWFVAPQRRRSFTYSRRDDLHFDPVMGVFIMLRDVPCYVRNC
jgi:hypothetical protein